MLPYTGKRESDYKVGFVYGSIFVFKKQNTDLTVFELNFKF